MNSKQEQWMSARGTRNPAMEIIRDHLDSYDAWGSALEAHFQICYTLTRGGVEVPEAWDFHPGMFVPEDDDNDPENEDGEGSLLGWELDLLLREGHVRNLIEAGNILGRYTALLELAGHSY